jgi:CubicO group peptidase (beta-lactamase class C family)
MKIKPDKPLQLKKLLLIAITAVMLLPGSLQAQSSKKSKASVRTKYTVIDSIIQHYVKQGNFSGVVTLAEKNKTTFNKGYGLANMELNVQNDTSTRFEIGSMSKQFCAALILIAESEGKISLDSALYKYLPYTQTASSGFGTVTIHQLLAMRSAIPSYDNFPNFITTVARRNFRSHEEFIMDQCSYPLQTTPGTAFSYSDGNYYILGAVLEKLYGMTYDKILEDKIFKPLKMYDSGFLTLSGAPNGGELVKNLNDGYQPITNVYDPETQLPIASHYQRGSWTNMSDIGYASGAIYMTGSDFIKWATALNNNTLFPEKYKKQMFTSYSESGVLDGYYPQKPNCPPTGYGFAMVIVHRPALPGTTKPIKIYTHGGLTPGYSSVGAMVEGHDMTIFITSNINSDAPLFMCWQIMNTLLGVPPNYGGIP